MCFGNTISRIYCYVWIELKQRDCLREGGREHHGADDSWGLLSDGNWTPTCCSLGSLLMNRKERGQRRRDEKEGRRKPSCVMHGHSAKASISFTKPWACPTSGWTICSYSAQGRQDRELLLHLICGFYPPLFFLCFFLFFIYFFLFSSVGVPLPVMFVKS